MIKLRKARADDYARLVGVDSFARVDPLRSKHIEEWIDKQDCWLAQMEEEIVGYGVMSYNFFKFGFIEMMTVDPRFRRIGVGNALLRHLSSECRTEKLWCTTNKSNSPMERLLRTHDFVLSGVILNLDEADPELVFLKQITSPNFGVTSKGNSDIE